MSHTSDHFAAILKLQTRMIEEGLAYVDPSPQEAQKESVLLTLTRQVAQKESVLGRSLTEAEKAELASKLKALLG